MSDDGKLVRLEAAERGSWCPLLQARAVRRHRGSRRPEWLLEGILPADGLSALWRTGLRQMFPCRRHGPCRGTGAGMGQARRQSPEPLFTSRPKELPASANALLPIANTMAWRT